MKKFDMYRALKWISAIVIGFGIVCSAWNVSHFSDENLGLMVGFGFLVGGIQILLFGMVAPLMQKKTEQAPLVESAQDPV